uniref:Receptor ligand binding region domain-containing protein n=1 Tax=Panagrolaimus sp. ES5 TaxID=591445 RepID=A0AC34FJ80_9BILA
MFGITRIFTQITQPTLKIGVLIAKDNPSFDSTIGFSRAAGGLTVALRRIQDEQLLKGYNLTFVFAFDQCNEALAAGGAINLIKEQGADVIIGPACSNSATVAALIAAFYNFPIFAWGTVLDSDLMDTDRFPTLATLGEVFNLYEWNEFAFFYAVRLNSIIPRCGYLQTDMDSYVSSMDNMTMVYKRSTVNDSYDSLRTILKRMKTRTRILVTCFEDNTDRRNFMLAALDEGLINNEFVFIFLQVKQDGFGYPNPFWIDTVAPIDGRDGDVKKACEKLLILDLQEVNTTYLNFSDDVLAAMYDWPILCEQVGDCPDKGFNASKQAAYLADSFYMYARSVNRTLKQNSTNPDIIHDGKLIVANSRGSFNGYSGQVTMSVNGTRAPVFYLFADSFYMYARSVNRTLKQNSTNPDIIHDGKLIVANSRGSFNGYSGQVTMSVNGTRAPVFYLFGLDSVSSTQKVFMIIENENNETSLQDIKLQYKDESVSIWKNFGGKRPLSRPLCGFTGSECPIPFFEQNLGYIIGGAILIIAVLIVFALVIYYSIKVKKEQKERLDQLWTIPFIRLYRPEEKGEVMKSARSLESHLSSTTSRFTINSKRETEHFSFFYFDKEPVVARKHASRPKLNESDKVIFRAVIIYYAF